jgi:hypothetical protein
VVLDHPDWTVVHVAIGAAHRMPVWPANAGRPRLLVESPGLAEWPGTAAARASGFSVITCPVSSAVRYRRCPAVAGAACPLASGADAILVTVGTDDPAATALLDAHSRVHAGVPVLLETRGDADGPAELPAGTRLMDRRLPLSERVAVLADTVAPVPTR